MTAARGPESRRRAGGALQLAIMRHEEAGNLLEELVEGWRSLSDRMMFPGSSMKLGPGMNSAISRPS